MYIASAGTRWRPKEANQLARDMSRVNVGRVKGVLFDIKCIPYPPALYYLCLYYLVARRYAYVTVAAPTSTPPVSLSRRARAPSSPGTCPA